MEVDFKNNDVVIFCGFNKYTNCILQDLAKDRLIINNKYVIYHTSCDIDIMLVRDKTGNDYIYAYKSWFSPDFKNLRYKKLKKINRSKFLNNKIISLIQNIINYDLL